MLCNKCSKSMGLLVLIIGIAFLLQDLKVWNYWGLNWWTLAFILVGLSAIASSACPMCKQANCCSTPETKSKKK